MSSVRILILTGVTLFALLGATVVAADGGIFSRVFFSNLRGENEVPAVETDGRGFATVFINRQETAIHFDLRTRNLNEIIQAHIHCGAEGVNGPVIAFLFGPATPPVTQDGLLSRGTITDANVIRRLPSAECPGGIANIGELIAKIKSGDAYVNVHTSANPGGEIRDQLENPFDHDD